MFSRSLASRKLVFAAVIAAVGMQGTALADRTIQPFRTFQTGRAVVWNSRNVHPQIQPPGPATKRIEENDWYTPPFNDPPNQMVSGGLEGARGGAPKVSFSGPGYTGFIPPDCDMGAGPGNVVACVNLQIAFYTKTGVKTFQQNMDQGGFWSGVGQNSEVYSDPKVFFDQVSGRWFVFMIEVNGLSSGTHYARVLVAVSATSDPNGTWFKYSLNDMITSGGNDFWADYPMVGMNKDGIVVDGNMFGFSGGSPFEQVMVIPKAPLLTGASATVTSFQDQNSFSVQPARSWDPNSSVAYLVGAGGGSSLDVFAVRNITSTPTLTQTSLTVPTFQAPPPAQSAGGNLLDTLGGRLFNCWYRSGKFVTAHTVATSQNAVPHVRWYEVNVNNWPSSGQPSLAQSGEINLPGGVASHMPAICQDPSDNISIIYTRSSSNIAADLVTSSRLSSDPPGVIGAPVLLQTSAGNYSGGRWGDFFSCVIDPADTTTFWGYGMTITNTGVWRTSVNSWQVGNGTVGTLINADSISTYLGTYVIGDETSLVAADGVSYLIGSQGIPQFGQAAGANVNFTVPTDSQHISVKLVARAGIAGGTNMIWLWNWAQDQYVLVGSVPLAASGNAVRTLAVPDSTVANYIGPNGEVAMQIRGHLPLRPPFNNGVPSPFTYQIDQLQLLVR